MLTTLPKLPIPDLNVALELYKKWVNPLLTSEQQKKCEETINIFRENEGIILDQKLRQYIDSMSDNKNWMAPYWTKMYLSIQDSLLTESNYGVHQIPFTQESDIDSTEYMARWIINSALLYKNMHFNPIKSYTEGKFEFCAQNTVNLFGCTRIPGDGMDNWENYDEFLKNIVVSYNHSYYVLPIFGDENNVISIANLQDSLKAILKNSDTVSSSFIPASFPGSKKAYSFLKDFLKNPINKKTSL